MTCLATESVKKDEEWLWNRPLAAIAKAKVPLNSLKAFIEEAVILLWRWTGTQIF